MMDPGAGVDSSSTANGTFGHNPWVDEDFVGATFSPGPIPDQASRSLQVDIVVCSILTLLIAITFVGLRFYVRGYVSKVLGWSDWVILPALVSGLHCRWISSTSSMLTLMILLALFCWCHSERPGTYVMSTISPSFRIVH